MEEEIKKLITKAVDADDYDASMKFAQAALNAANALRALADIKVMSK